jgi:hypothetical protein
LLFSNAFSSSDCVASKDRKINELERMWKEAFVAWFKIVYRNVPGGTEEKHKTEVRIA